MLLTEPANRAAFKADERGYMNKYRLTEAEAGLIERRDWAALIEAGGNIYLLLKIAGIVGQNLLQMGAQMRGETLDTFMQTRPRHRLLVATHGVSEGQHLFSKPLPEKSALCSARNSHPEDR